MTKEEFQAKLPLLLNWIGRTVATHGAQAKTVASLNFPRLPHYFSPALLLAARVVAVETVPMPPLSAMGLGQFFGFENMDAHGITYLDTFFVRADRAKDERLHFHELIHVIQWRVLGPESFLATYADGLERFGYRDSPLEAMAYDADQVFRRQAKPFNAEAYVKRKLFQLRGANGT